MSVTLYTTKTGDRWDTVAFLAYGTVGRITLADGTDKDVISIIAEANPTVPLTGILPEGIAMNIPIVETPAVVDIINVPPWKR